jgi:hypothetical protein
MNLTFNVPAQYSPYYYFCCVKKFSGYFIYFFYWLLFFVITRLLFLVYHFSLTKTLSGSEILKVFLYGLRMDISFTSYICIFPFLLFFIKFLTTKINIQKVISIYTNFLIILLSFLATADLQLYNAWGYRMDATPLQYLKSPK